MRSIERTHEAATTIARRADEIEDARRLPQDLIDELADLGLFRLWVPPDLGGEGADIRSAIEAIEAISRVDGSAGWVVMIGMTTAIIAGHVTDDVAREIYASDPRVVTGGVIAPMGRARRTDDGYVVSGRWTFASGCEHCAWLVGGALVMTDDGPETLPSGLPDIKLMVFPAQDVDITDNWDVMGLRGTGSHDISVTDAMVPAGRSFSFLAPPRMRDDALSALPPPTPLALALAAVPIGIARGAIDDIIGLATEKTPAMSMSTLAKRAHVQIDIARADVELRAARSLLLQTADEVWSRALTGETPTDVERAQARAAAIHAATTAASVIDLAYTLGGGTSLRSSSLLQRRLRDVHAATQHAIVGRAPYETIGRILMGLPADAAML